MSAKLLRLRHALRITSNVLDREIRTMLVQGQSIMRPSI